MKKKYLLHAMKMEFIPARKMKCPKSGIFVNNYMVGLVWQSNFAGYQSIFSGTVKILF